MPFTRWRKESLSVMMARGEKKGEVVVEVLLPRLLLLPAFFLSPFPKWSSDYCGSNSKREREGSERPHPPPPPPPPPRPPRPPPARRWRGISRPALSGHWRRSPRPRGRRLGSGGRTELEGNACVHEIEGTLSIPDKTFGSTSFPCGRRGGCAHFTPCCCPTFISR